jgi:hypothetical protein
MVKSQRVCSLRIVRQSRATRVMSTLGGIAVFQNLAPGEFIKTICVRKDAVAPSKGWGCFTEPPVKSRSAKLGARSCDFQGAPGHRGELNAYQ